MIELVFVVCLSTAPTTCERQTMLFVEGSWASCIFDAQPQMARWIGAHPGWRVTRWSCGPRRPGHDA